MARPCWNLVGSNIGAKNVYLDQPSFSLSAKFLGYYLKIDHDGVLSNTAFTITVEFFNII